MMEGIYAPEFLAAARNNVSFMLSLEPVANRQYYLVPNSSKL